MKTTKQLFGILILTFGVLFQMQGQNPFTNGLVAYYPFKGDATDASGNGNHGSLVGNDEKFLGDRFGYTNSLWLNTTSTPAWNLNGAYVSAPRSLALDFNSDFTLSVWVNFTNTTPLPNGTGGAFVHSLISNGDDSSSVNLRYETDIGGEDLLQFIWGGPNSSIDLFLSPQRQSWMQITAVRSGTSLTLYKNGQILTNGFVIPAVNSTTILIGRHGNGGGNGSYYPLVGGIDDVRMYSRALSAAEVQDLYLVESGPHTDIAKAVRLDFTHLQIGGNYQVQFSHDLNNWTNLGSAFAASSPTNSQYMDVTDWNTFWRLKVVP